MKRSKSAAEKSNPALSSPMTVPKAPGFAYVFERFPSFTQTFCYREVQEMCKAESTPAIYSIRTPNDVPADCPEALLRATRYLPKSDELSADSIKWTAIFTRPFKATRIPWNRDFRPDRQRIFEALWLGPRLKAEGVRHVHSHFAGVAARTAYWLKQFFGITYSITAHANDVFCDSEFPVSIKDILREADFIVTVSDFSRGWLAERSPDCASKVHRVYNGMDLSGIPAARPADGKPHILSVGRCIEKKGYADLIEACAILRERGLEFECSIVGGGPLEESLREQVTRLGLQAVVHMTGPRPQEEVREMLAGSALFVLACATESDGGMDNLPTVIVEAMAYGLPVVSTKLAGVPEMVEHGASGLLVEEKDPLALADALEALLSDPLKRVEYGARGRILAEERFPIAGTVGQLRELLDRHSRI